ncbi:hypothetical protein BCR36DRAFT_373110 [Piromyces finnis]|uniref:Uncharacterized protein n=1 Tax=Piromyces finnis TaxID=1754191 RepID=A0A1Y1V0G2_9FUNG|nr:hypothetical protein BCR36DRAFT_373110 [Piromyces finnis]|eukprot:ORX44636.1 hypothetical protein BCR36DRAFT_373110 [Piromyces finnis]
MTNDKNIISKLTKGLKLKINKKKKSNWKTLNSNEYLLSTPTPTHEEHMLFSDTEVELYQAKANIEANRSFTFNNNSNENNIDTKNVLNNTFSVNVNVIGRSKTYNSSSSYTYNNRPTIGPNIQNKYTPNSTTESRKNSFQTIYSPQNNNLTQSGMNHCSSFSNNSTPYTSAPNSPISIDSSDTYVNEIKANFNNPFLKNNAINNIKPKTNAFLSVSTTNMDPALSHSLISPIEFDVAGKEIKTSEDTTTTAPQNISTGQINTNEQVPRNKSVKRTKPLITFDTPPVVSPITAETDSDEYIRGRKRSGKKHKKYTKKRSSNLTLKTNNLKDMTKNMTFSEPTSAIVARANSRLNSPNSISNEEDDDVPLGIIQYKCISSILKETGPTNISSLQSNTKKTKSHSKDNYGYMSPPHESYLEKYKKEKRKKKYHKKSNNYLKNKLSLHKVPSHLKNTLKRKDLPPPSPPQIASHKTLFFGNYFNSESSSSNNDIDSDTDTDTNDENEDDYFNANSYFHQYREEDNISPKQTAIEIDEVVYGSGTTPISINYANSNMNADLKMSSHLKSDFDNPNPYMNLEDVFNSQLNTNMYNPFEYHHYRLRNANSFLYDEHGYKTY